MQVYLWMGINFIWKLVRFLGILILRVGPLESALQASFMAANIPVVEVPPKMVDCTAKILKKTQPA